MIEGGTKVHLYHISLTVRSVCHLQRRCFAVPEWNASGAFGIVYVHAIHQATASLRFIFVNFEPLPSGTGSLHRRNPAKGVVYQSSDEKAAKEVEIIDVCSAFGYFIADSPGEADHVDQYAGNVSSVSPPVNAKGVMIRSRAKGRIQVAGLQISLADGVVVAHHNACNARQED